MNPELHFDGALMDQLSSALEKFGVHRWSLRGTRELDTIQEEEIE